MSKTLDLTAWTPGIQYAYGGANAIEPAQLPQHGIVAPPSWSVDDRVLAHFFSRWAAGSTCLGSQSFISKLYESSAGHSAMRSAIEATAYADLAVVERHGIFATKSFLAYLTALRRMQSLLNDFSATGDVNRSETLTAILTLDSLEVSL